MADTATLSEAASIEGPEEEISFPAIILCDEETDALKVAGLRILDRLIVATHRARVARITVVSSKPLPPLPRATALGISFQRVTDVPTIEQPTLVLSTGLLVQAADLKALLRSRGRLIGRDGVPLPAGVIAEAIARDLEGQLNRLPKVVAQGVAAPITGASSVPAASRALWGSLGSPLDGVVDKYFNRPIGHILTKQLVHTPVSPNQVSAASILLGLLSAWLFAGGTHDTAVWGAIALQLSAILDAVDGDLARVAFKESALGKWLDIVGDQVVHVAVFVAIGAGLYRAGSAAPVIPLAVSSGAGVVISLIVIVRCLKQLERRSDRRLQRLIEATANRDFSILLLVLALVDKLDWFLWMTAFGVHVFWIAVLIVQRSGALRTDRAERAP